jgi:pimeloyl-ACP methyl ester carboxylesterase
VLEAGASAFAIDWPLVQPEIAKLTRVCSYDRAGYGWSDEGPVATAARIVAALHALLSRLGDKPPYVMVGASAGGLYVRTYDYTYPGEVAGFVLVDPAHEDRLFTFFKGEAVAIASLTAEQLRTTRPSQPAIQDVLVSVRTGARLP